MEGRDLHAAHVEVRELLVGISFLLLPFGFQGLNPGPQAWWKTSLPTKPTCQPPFHLFWKICSIWVLSQEKESVATRTWAHVVSILRESAYFQGISYWRVSGFGHRNWISEKVTQFQTQCFLLLKSPTRTLSISTLPLVVAPVWPSQWYLFFSLFCFCF